MQAAEQVNLLSPDEREKIIETIDVYRARATFRHEFPGQDYPDQLLYLQDEARQIFQWALGNQKKYPQLNRGKRVGSPRSIESLDILETERNDALTRAQNLLPADEWLAVSKSITQLDELMGKGFGVASARLVLASLATTAPDFAIASTPELSPTEPADLSDTSSTTEPPLTPQARPLTPFDTGLPYNPIRHMAIIRSLKAAGVEAVMP